MDKLQTQEYLTQGSVLAGQGKHEAALAYFDKAEKEDPMNIEVYLSKGIAYANLDDLNEAKHQFEKALKVNRKSGLAYFHLGSIEMLLGNTAAGIENYNKAIANGYDDAQLYYSLGLLCEEQQDFDMAVRNYSKAIQRDSLRPDIRIRKARILIRSNHLPEAMQVLDETILTNPDVFEGYHIKFSLLMQMNQFDEAEKLLNTALDLFPQDYGFALDKVSLRIQQGKVDEALEILAELENADDADDSLQRRVYMERAQIHADCEDVDGAVAALEQAKSLSEKNGAFDAEVVFLLASCHLSQEKYDELLEDALQLLEKADDGYNKETARYFEPLALKMLGRTDEAMSKYKDAIEEYRRQSLDAPGNLDAYLLRAMCLRDIEQHEKALELISYVVTLQPDRAEPRIVKVSLLEALGRTEEAEQESQLLSELLPDELRRK